MPLGNLRLIFWYILLLVHIVIAKVSMTNSVDGVLGHPKPSAVALRLIAGS